MSSNTIVPNFPAPVDGVEGYNSPKLSFEKLTEYYDLLTSVGCDVAPKRRNEKIPVGTWKEATYTRIQALKAQLQDDVSGWCVRTGYGRVFVVDLDTQAIIDGGRTVQDVYNELQALSPTGFVIATPANGVHLYYKIPDGLEMLTNENNLGITGVDVRGMGGQVVSLGGFNHYADGKSKGVPDGHTSDYGLLDDGIYTYIPEMSRALYERLTAGHTVARLKGKNSGSSAKGTIDLERLVKGLKNDFVPKAFPKSAYGENVSEILELAQFAARLWSTDVKPSYDLWRQFCFSVHYASDGSDIVRDFILNEPLFWRWNDNNDFADWWDTITDDTDTPATIGTLKRLAKVAGWGTYSQFGLKRVDQEINSRYLGDGLTDVQRGRVNLIKQQTGGGKTTFAMHIASQYKPSRVLFLAPFTSLAYDVAGKTPIPCGVYKDKWDRTIALAATLQYVCENRILPTNFDLVVIDEVHQLVKHLCGKSHMRTEEKIAAFKWLHELFQSDATVIAADAGINQNTVDFIDALAGKAAHVIHNSYIERKSDVHVIDRNEGLFKIKTANGRVVVAADTLRETRKLENCRQGATVVINRDTRDKAKVKRFFKSVEVGAKTYDTVIYNSSMGQGVSISETTPDFLIQFSTYLSASSNIQLLNRYRNQGDSVYLVYEVPTRARIDAQSALGSIDRAFKSELGALQNILKDDTSPVKSKLAALIDEFTARIIVEENEQFISPFEFYRAVLEADGREVIGKGVKVKSEDDKALRATDKQLLDSIKDTWPSVLPYDETEGAEHNMSTRERLEAGLHNDTMKLWMGEPNLTTYAPRIIADAANQYGKGNITHIERKLEPTPDFTRSIILTMGSNVGKGEITLQGTVFLLLTACSQLMPDLEGTLTHETLEAQGEWFLTLITGLKAQYKAYTRKSILGDEKAIDVFRTIMFKVGLRLQAIDRREGGRGEQQRVKDAQGNVIKDYRIADVDLLKDILRHRKAKRDNKPLEEVVISMVWGRAYKQRSEIDAVISNDLLIDLADMKLDERRRKLIDIIMELVSRDVVAAF